MGAWFTSISLGNLIAGIVGGNVDPEKLAEMPALFQRTAISLFIAAALLLLLVVPIRTDDGAERKPLTLGPRRRMRHGQAKIEDGIVSSRPFATSRASRKTNAVRSAFVKRRVNPALRPFVQRERQNRRATSAPSGVGPRPAG